VEEEVEGESPLLHLVEGKGKEKEMLLHLPGEGNSGLGRQTRVLEEKNINWEDLEAKAASGKEVKLEPQLVLDLLQELRLAEKDRDGAKLEIDKMLEHFNIQSTQLEKLREELENARMVSTNSDELASLKKKISALEQSNNSKDQFIAQLEQDVTDVRKRLEEGQGKRTEAEDAAARIQELEFQLNEKDQEIANLKNQLKETNDA